MASATLIATLIYCVLLCWGLIALAKRAFAHYENIWYFSRLGMLAAFGWYGYGILFFSLLMLGRPELGCLICTLNIVDIFNGLAIGKPEYGTLYYFALSFINMNIMTSVLFILSGIIGIAIGTGLALLYQLYININNRYVG